MSILFDDASSQYLSNSNAIVPSGNATISLWFNTNDGTITQVMASIGSSSTTQQVSLLIFAGTNVRANLTLSGSSINVTSSNTLTTNAWQHAALVTSGATAAVWLNGTKTTSGAIAIGTLTVDRTHIGARANSGTPNYFSGMLAEVAFWNARLADAEVASLAAGFSPKLISPQNLQSYCPLLDQASPSIDVRGGFNMTWNASPIIGSTHPAMIGG